MLLQRCEGGVDAALQYAKDMAKYMKDLIGYLDKRTALGEGPGDARASWAGPAGELGGARGRPIPNPGSAPPLAEMEFAKGLQKVVHSCRQSITHEVRWAERETFERCVGVRRPGRCLRLMISVGGPACLGPGVARGSGTAWVPSLVTSRLCPQPHMPLLSIYSLALEQDLDFGHGMVQAAGTLQTQTFMQVGCAPAEVAAGQGRPSPAPHSQPCLRCLAPDPAALGA